MLQLVSLIRKLLEIAIFAGNTKAYVYRYY